MSRPPADAAVDSTSRVGWVTVPNEQQAPEKSANEQAPEQQPKPVEASLTTEPTNQEAAPDNEASPNNEASSIDETSTEEKPSSRSKAIVTRKIPELQTPQFIGVYEIREEVGRGAFGRVHRALDSRSEGREVAIKLFMNRMTTKEAEVRFRREVEIASSLDHPNISSIIDYGTHEELPYIIMRLIRGETLNEKVKRDGSLPPGEAARIIQRLAIAIQHAHSRDVIHRDLKPSNVIIEQGDPVVVDLGLSKSLLTTESFTGKGDLLGSPLFMSPEQLFGEKADVRADVFGLGGLLYFLLTGQPPRTLEDFRRRLTPEPHLAREIPSGLAAICKKALAEEPSRRFYSAADMGVALEDWLEGRTPDFDHQNPFNEKIKRAAIVLIICILGLLWWFNESNPDAILFDENVINKYRVSEALVLVKDGRALLDSEGSFRFPCLKVMIQGKETFSPPRQQLTPDRHYFVGLDVEGAVLARFSFREGVSPIHGKARFEHIPLSDGPETHLLTLHKNDQGFFLGEQSVDGFRIEVSGFLRGSDARGLQWAWDSKDQLVASIAGQSSWSPPRPMNRTEYGVEYPVGLIGERFITARFSPSRNTADLSVRLFVYDKDSTKD